MSKVNNIKEGIFIREPIEELSKDILSSKKNVIIFGNKGTGKTTMLNYIVEKGLYVDDKYINVDVNALKLFDDYENSELLESYYEIYFSLRLLYYIKRYYSLIFEKEFKNDFDSLILESQKLDNYINERFFKDNISKPEFHKVYEFSNNIINRIKSHFKTSELNLVIDNFDLINSSDERAQKLLSKYFKLFDKSIISVNDDNIVSDNFDKYKIKYNKEVIKLILLKKMKSNYELNKVLQNDLYNSIFTIVNDDDNLDLLIQKTNGNLNLMLNVLKKISIDLEINFFMKANNIILDNYIEDELESYNRVKSYSHNSRFYL